MYFSLNHIRLSYGLTLLYFLFFTPFLSVSLLFFPLIVKLLSIRREGWQWTSLAVGLLSDLFYSSFSFGVVLFLTYVTAFLLDLLRKWVFVQKWTGFLLFSFCFSMFFFLLESLVAATSWTKEFFFFGLTQGSVHCLVALFGYVLPLFLFDGVRSMQTRKQGRRQRRRAIL